MLVATIMPLPFPEFAEPTAQLLPTFDVLPYSELPQLATEAPILGEFVEAAGEVALAGALAEPALILGTGLLAGAAAEAIFNKLNPSSPKPVQKGLPTGGRIAGGSFRVGVNYQTTGAGNVNTEFIVAGNVLGLTAGGFVLGSILYYIFYEGGKELVLSDPPADIQVAPNIIYILGNGSTPNPDIPTQPSWVNPGIGILPAPTMKNRTLPDGTNQPYQIQPLPNPRNLPTAQPNQPYSPGITVYSPEFGIAVNFSPTSIRIAYTTSISTSISLRPPTGSYDGTPLPPEACPCPTVDLSEVIRRLKDLENCDRCNDYTYTSHDGGSGNSGTQNTGSDQLVSVTINVTSEPSNVKNQYGGGNAPDVVYAGWFAFIINGKPSERIPIQYAQQTFVPPGIASGFCWTGYTGVAISCGYVTRRRNNPPDPG